MPSSTFKPLSRIVICLALVLIWPAAQAQTTYNFTRIDNGFFPVSAGVSIPSLNDAGRVAFRAVAGGVIAIFFGTGQEQNINDYVVIARTQLGSFIVGVPGSYVGSRVAFQAEGVQVSGRGYFSADGVSLRTIVIDSGSGNFIPWMNRAGQVGYSRSVLATAEGGIYVGQNGASQLAYTNEHTRAFGFRGLVGSQAMVVNDAGEMFFGGVFSNLPTDTNTPQLHMEGLLRGDGSGKIPSMVVDTEITFNSEDEPSSTEIKLWAVNNAGQAACVVGGFDGNVTRPRKVIKVSGGAITTVMDTSIGAASAISEIPQMAIDDNGKVVFRANYTNALGQFQFGLFTGQDMVKDKIIATGDPLFGSVVFALDISQFGVNKSGQIAFRVVLQNNQISIVRADPVVGGGTVVEWVSGSGGSFDATSNWQPTNGDPPRVPEKSAFFDDTALFDGCAQYVIDVGQASMDRMRIRCGDVTLHNGDITLASLSPFAPSLEIGGTGAASLTLDGNTLHTSHAAIGFGQTGKMTIKTGSSWQSQGRVEVGKDGDGALEIHDVVGSAESRIGNGAGQGKVVVDGPSAVWTTGNLAAGYDGTGTLRLTNEATVFSDSAFIGLLSASSGEVDLDGDSSSTPPKYVNWKLGAAPELGVGQAGSGGIFVHNAARIVGSNANLAIGAGSSGFGVVRVFSDPGDPNDPQRFGHLATLNAKFITVGQSGNGFLGVGPNALCVCISGLLVGDAGKGVVLVNGGNGSFPPDFAQLEANGFVSVGDSSGHGQMEIRNGGLVSGSKNASIGLNDRRGSGYVIVDGADSRWEVGTDLDMGQNGNSTIELQNGGTLDVAGTVFVRSHGAIMGNGTLHAGQRVVNGGYISPGLSPGRLVLEGDYQQTAGGRLKIEVGGLDPGVSHDQFVVHGDATFGGTLELRFINGFAPKEGDTFNFLLVRSNLNNSFATTQVKNLAPDFQFEVSTNGANLSLVAMNDGVFVTPLQGQISSSNVVTVGGISYLPYTINIDDFCTIVESTGPLTRQGQELFQTLSEKRDPNCLGASANASHTLPLGALPPGRYDFHFKSDGVVVYTISFDVPADASQLLTFTRTASGELDLHINGVDFVQYTIQASKDLKEWFDVPAHVGAFFGPYHIFEPFSASKARFYRVKIE
jgi:T5SS/PEP-CTERM-associated repeat protein